MIAVKMLGLWAMSIVFTLVAGSCVPVGNRFDAQVLRIMPLGASIVYGADSSDGNGFRNALRLQLLSNGANVNMIGSRRGGTMPDNYVEAVGGYRIDQVSSLADNSIPSKPNLVIIHVGTNDILQGYQLNTVDQRLGALIDKLLAAIPGTSVLVSTLIPNLNATANSGIQDLNPKIRQVVADRVGAGKHVQLADMSAIQLSDLNTADGTHPTDGGYAKMANIWYAGVQQIFAQCWISPPAAVAGVNDLAYTTVFGPAATPAPQASVESTSTMSSTSSSLKAISSPTTSSSKTDAKTSSTRVAASESAITTSSVPTTMTRESMKSTSSVSTSTKAQAPSAAATTTQKSPAASTRRLDVRQSCVLLALCLVVAAAI